jgi:hypothetical protein
MEKNITLRGRGTTHTLEYLQDNNYLLNTEFNYRISKDGDNIKFIDPAGGPMLRKGGEVSGFYIKDIRFSEDNPKGYIFTLISNRNRKIAAVSTQAVQTV